MGNNFGVIGAWHKPSLSDIRALEDELCPGDRLEIDNGIYAHWGIYVGRYQHMEHAVIHFGMFDKRAAFSKKKISGSAFAAGQKPEIRANTIGKILGGSDKVRINNSRDEQVKPLDPDVIIKVAKELHQNKTPINYDLFNYNCEHFVNLCRYDKPHSDQSTDALLTIGVLGLIGAGAGRRGIWGSDPFNQPLTPRDPTMGIS
ncbi:phospholipase A and acyltransferase 3-like [Patiria miniata]|uniref:LRAT domain-containing protein n=1 Tax=Patiria miniata TaxID=46514 RepID=A0A914AF07_PATMI|nr:phospholipase A and acyltransferase 3-like [Patiria miniata]